ncbi:MAG: helix-turn-helix transcriptional regulator [Halodesulfurarchaeum sp.]
MGRSLLVGALLVCLLVLSSSPAAAAPTHVGTTFAVEIQETGDAVWTVRTSYRLETAADRAAFEKLAAEYEASGSVGPSVAVFERAAARVAETTGRNMAITNVTRTSSVIEGENVTGTLRLTFTWTNFAVVSESQISVKTAFGAWFGDLEPRQTLTIEPPPGYRVQTATPSTELMNGALHWEGPQSFEANEPTVVFEKVTIPGAGLRPTTVLAGVVILVLGGIFVGWRAGALSVGSASREGTNEADSPGPAPSGEPEPADSGETAEPTEPEGGESESELLSDEERVERLLRENDGRMKQARIVEETRWSNAKVSQLLSAMAEEGRIEKLRIGRENLISLPDEFEEE